MTTEARALLALCPAMFRPIASGLLDQLDAAHRDAAELRQAMRQVIEGHNRMAQAVAELRAQVEALTTTKH